MTARRLAQLVGGCFVLGVGVTLLLTPALGSDGFSSLVNGISLATGMPFVIANLLVSVVFVALAWVRGVRPGVGTVIQIVVVGSTVSALLPLLEEPDAWWTRTLMLGIAFPVLAIGIALYLGSHLGAGPAEAAALAWDPPVPFAWSYSLVQGGGALAGWQLGAAIGPGTVAVIVLLGPVVTLAGRLLRLDLHQSP
ncbi:MAG TPA: hypothetical protein VFG72_06815 [Marmoricola sp.]|nr:hypothetical protein [Marmoricola sp.]